MYSRAEASKIKEAFWTAFGRFMAIHPNSEGEKINWVNYHTGFKDVYFRMDVDQKKAAISIQFTHPDALMRTLYYDKLEEFYTWFAESMGEEWIWVPEMQNEQGKLISKVYLELPSVNIFKQEQWPEIVSFLKPRIIALDAFWNEVKDAFEELK